MTAYAVAFAVALVLGIGFTEVVRRFAVACGLTDDPGGHKGHRTPTPLLGGVGVAAAIALATLPAPLEPLSRLLVLAALALGVLGLADDLRPLSPFVRLAAEAIVCGGLARAGVHASVTGIAAVDVVLSAVWMVLMVNAVNLLDNADGILATLCAVTAGALAVAVPSVLPYALGGAALGFLCHNRPPARIFLGDAGSLFLGTLLAGSALLATRGVGVRVGVGVPVDVGVQHVAWLLLISAPAVTDTAVVVISRRRSGRSILQGGTDHGAHRLRRLGLSPRQTMAAVAAYSAVTAGLGCLVQADVLPGRAALVGAVLLIGLAVALILRIPGYPDATAVPSQPVTRQMPARVDRPH